MITKYPTCAVIMTTMMLAACAPVETTTSLTTPVSGQVRSAGPGDTVMSFQSQRSLPNVFGRADLFGRTTNAGRTTIRYIGTQGSRAVFERSDVIIDSNATTMTESPMIIPQTTTTTLRGSVGMTPVSGTASSTSYRYIPPRGSSQQVVMQRPVTIVLGSGESVPVEGRAIRVVRVNPSSVDYIIE